jgi:hypothetical protein
MHQASLFGRPRRQHSQQNPCDATSPAQPPEQIAITQTPSRKGRDVLPIEDKAGVTFIET